MDYGPAMAITCGIAKDNIAYKGILIPLNKEKTLNALFDTELLRVTAVWSGGFLNWASRNYADNNNDYCTADGKIEFSTPRLPGCAKDGKFDDPRNPRDGPLPADWAKYKGLYLAGDKTVLSYTIYNVPILETFGGETLDGQSVFTRMIQVAPSPVPIKLFLFEIPAGEIQTELQKATPNLIAIREKDSFKCAQVSGSLDGVHLIVEEASVKDASSPRKSRPSAPISRSTPENPHRLLKYG